MRCEFSVRCVTVFMSKIESVLNFSGDERTAVEDQAIKGPLVLEAEFASVPLCVSEFVPTSARSEIPFPAVSCSLFVFSCGKRGLLLSARSDTPRLCCTLSPLGVCVLGMCVLCGMSGV